MKTIFVCVISFFISFSAIAQNSVMLKLNLEKNKIYRIKSTSDQNVTQTMGGASQTSQVKSNSVTSIKVVDLKAEFMIAEIRFDTIAVNTNAMGTKVIINSAIGGNLKSNDVSEVMGCFMNRMSKNPLFVKLDYSGKILEIVNAKAFSDIVLKDIDSVKLEGPTAAMVPSQIKNMADEKALKSMVELLTNYLPNKQVVVGDKWDVNNSMSANGMLFTISSAYKLESINNNLATISSDANVLPAGSEPMEMMGVKINYSDLKGLSKSTLLVDTKTGMIIESTGKTNMSGNLAIDIPGNPMQIPMSVIGESKIVALP